MINYSKNTLGAAALSHQNILQNVYLFNNFSVDQLEKVSEIAELKTFAAGETVFSQGANATAMYIIKFGSVRIIQESDSGEKIEVAVLGPGSHFGEMAFIDEERRSAAAVCMERSEIVTLDFNNLRQLIDKDVHISSQLYKDFSHFLTARLRITTNDLTYAREKNLSHF